MKKTIILLVFIIAALRVFPDSLDSLNAQRERLYGKYSELNLPGRELTNEDSKKSDQLLKDMVIVDTKIISQLSNFGKKVKEYDARIAALVVEKNGLSEKLSASTDRLFIIYIASGAIVCMLVISLVFLISSNIKLKKLKKKTATFNEMLNSSETDRALAKQLTEDLRLRDKSLAEKNALLASLQKEIETFKNKIKELQDTLDDIKNQTPQPPPPPPPPDPMINAIPVSNEEIAQFDMNIVKLEKLSRMKELGIVTEDEFNTFRKKFLGEL